MHGNIFVYIHIVINALNFDSIRQLGSLQKAGVKVPRENWRHHCLWLNDEDSHFQREIQFLSASWYLVTQLFNSGAATSSVAVLLKHQLGILQQCFRPPQVTPQHVFNVCQKTTQNKF